MNIVVIAVESVDTAAAVDFEHIVAIAVEHNLEQSVVVVVGNCSLLTPTTAVD